MAHKKRKLVIILSAALTITGCSVRQNTEVMDTEYAAAPEAIALDAGDVQETDADGKEVLTSMTEEEIPAMWQIDVPEVYQEPELPTGCESVALTMMLMHYGFELEKTTIAEDYLLYSENSDFSEGFVGSPWSYEGAGCFPPVLTKTANIYLDEFEAELSAVNLSGSSLEELFHYVANDIPVAVWTTMYMAEPVFYEDGFEDEDIWYTWYENEHCVVLSGYNLETGTVTINDPLEGIVERDMEEFEYIYDIIGQYSLMIL